MLEKLRGPLRPVSEFVAKFFIWMHPNTISLIGFCLGFIPVFLYLKGQPRLAGVALIVYFFDFLDGAVARFTGKTSIFGAVLDATLDRIMDGLIIFSIIQAGFVNWNLGIIVLLGFLLISYVRARTGEALYTASAKEKIVLDVGLAQRSERVVILILASILYFERISIPIINISVNSLEIAFGLLAILTWETIVHRLIFAYKKCKVLENG